jgi:F0F1-type ATP synthase assembly protein I
MTHEELKVVKKDDQTRSLLLVFGIVADVSWRMFVPVVGLTVVGYFVDATLHSRPWGIISCMFLGLIIAGILVVDVYQRAKKEEKR